MPIPPPPRPAEILLFTKKDSSAPVELKGAALTKLRAEAQRAAKSSIPTPAVSVYANNVALQERVQLLERQLRDERQRNAELIRQLGDALTFYVPPPTFLPQQFYQKNRAVIDALNDYALLYRSATWPLLEQKWHAKESAAELQQPTSKEDVQDKDATIAMLKSRVAQLSSSLMTLLQQPLHETEAIM